MIFVDRGMIQVPTILEDPNGKGYKERSDAIMHYSGSQRKEIYKKYKIYRDASVKEALVELFNGKCAYCESRFLHTYPGDVEHYRPKAEIAEASPIKPGYYWLASSWDNLLLSCRNCNQKLSHQIYGQSNKKSMGKMNQFPLLDESKRIRNHLEDISLEEEYRLLLNPCIDNPENHLEYDEKTAVIKAKKINGDPSKKGTKSIEVYVLQRSHLVHAREKVLLEILAQIQRVKEAIINVNDNANNPDTAKVFYFEKILRLELLNLKRFLHKKSEYLGLARQVIGKFLEQFSVNLR